MQIAQGRAIPRAGPSANLNLCRGGLRPARMTTRPRQKFLLNENPTLDALGKQKIDLGNMLCVLVRQGVGRTPNGCRPSTTPCKGCWLYLLTLESSGVLDNCRQSCADCYETTRVWAMQLEHVVLRCCCLGLVHCGRRGWLGQLQAEMWRSPRGHL